MIRGISLLFFIIKVSWRVGANHVSWRVGANHTPLAVRKEVILVPCFLFSNSQYFPRHLKLHSTYSENCTQRTYYSNFLPQHLNYILIVKTVHRGHITVTFSFPPLSPYFRINVEKLSRRLYLYKLIILIYNYIKLKTTMTGIKCYCENLLWLKTRERWRYWI